MGRLIINGGKKLEGVIETHSAKNAVLPILAASILTNEEVIIDKCPRITDVLNMIEILKSLGAKVVFEEDKLIINSSNINSYEIPSKLASELRSSIFMLGSILSRTKFAKVAYPGGCDIGERPIDLHISGLKALNVSIKEENGYISCDGRNMKSSIIILDFASVGATENIMLASVFIDGVTIIKNSAKEPEIIDLQNFLNKMGAKIRGAGSSTIEIEGVKTLHGTEYTPIPDRIVAGTYLLAGAITGGEIEVLNVNYEHIYSLVNKLQNSSCKIDLAENRILLKAPKKCDAVQLVQTMPYPAFPTDLQAQFMALMSVANGISIVEENIFETRFRHAYELKKMGANITVRGRTAIVRGVNKLHGAEIVIHDLRGGAGLVLAGLAAEGKTLLNDVYHIDRGYEKIETALSSLGASIYRI